MKHSIALLLSLSASQLIPASQAQINRPQLNSPCPSHQKASPHQADLQGKAAAQRAQQRSSEEVERAALMVAIHALGNRLYTEELNPLGE